MTFRNIDPIVTGRIKALPLEWLDAVWVDGTNQEGHSLRNIIDPDYVFGRLLYEMEIVNAVVNECRLGDYCYVIDAKVLDGVRVLESSEHPIGTQYIDNLSKRQLTDIAELAGQRVFNLLRPKSETKSAYIAFCEWRTLTRNNVNMKDGEELTLPSLAKILSAEVLEIHGWRNKLTQMLDTAPTIPKIKSAPRYEVD